MSGDGAGISELEFSQFCLSILVSVVSQQVALGLDLYVSCRGGEEF